MWDAIKKAVGNALEGGEAFLRHSAAIEHILNSPNVDIGLYKLQAHVFGLENAAEFDRFKNAIAYQIGLTQMALQQAQTNANNSWGSSTEDRIAYLSAHISAGEPSGVSGETQAAQLRLQGLAYMQQLADPMWAAAQQAKPPPAEIQPG